MYIHIIILNDLKPNFKLVFVIVFFTIYSVKIYAQSFELKIYLKDSIYNYVIDSIPYKSIHANKKSVYQEIDAVSNTFSLKGYINNNYNIEENDSIINCFFKLNNKVNNIRVYYKKLNLPPKLLQKLSATQNLQYFESTTNAIGNKLETITKFYEKQGYTFIKTSLKNLNLKNNRIQADLFIETSTIRTLNKIVIEGYMDFPKKYLKHYLELKKNKVFNTELLQETQNKINTIPFVSQLKKPEVLFTKDSTVLYLYLNKKNINQFDGIIGFSNSENNSLNINGYLNLYFNNIFNKGEQIDINWKNNGDKNTTLNIQLNTPYILRSKFSLNGGFNIYKQDSLYNTVNTKIALVYNINKSQSISGNANFINSNTLGSIELNGVETYNKKLFGATYMFQSQNYNSNNKLSIALNYLFGNRNTFSTKNKQSKILGIIHSLWSINGKNQIFIKNTTELLNTSIFLENELFQIGGVNSIRGFDDQSILTSTYNITNLEYKFFTNSINYLYTITDLGVIKNKLNDTQNTLIGLGVGYNFKSNNSIVNLSYAIGKSENQPFKFNNAKLHIKLSYNF